MSASAALTAASALLRPDRLIMAIVFGGALVAGWALLPAKMSALRCSNATDIPREALAILEQKVEAWRPPLPDAPSNSRALRKRGQSAESPSDT